jgi:hypothetical protein
MRRTNFSPQLRQDELGISISVKYNKQEDGGERAYLYGCFRLPTNYEKLLIGIPHKAIILVVTLGEYSFAENVFKDMVFFDDDVTIDAESVLGYFDMALFDHIEYFRGNYNILVSLGPFSSNIEVFDHTPISRTPD